MASLMENLIDVLDRESTEYEALLQLSQRKTSIIAGGDLAELQKITDEEQELVSRIHNLDKQRAGVTEGKKYDLCIAIGPMIMMKFVCLLTKELEIPTVVSLNPIMVDGTGMCGKVKFACVDGPEFDGHEVNFDEAMRRQQIYKTAEGRAMLALEEGDTHHGGCGNCQ